MADKMTMALYDLRTQLKAKGYKETGRTPIVCTDEVLKSIIDLRPRTIEDFRSIPGIGEKFIETYANDFLSTMDKNETDISVKTCALSPSVTTSMKELEKRLVNINKKNRLLYSVKNVAKYCWDLYNPERADARELIWHGNKTVTICNTTRCNNLDYENKRYRAFTTLNREVNKDLRDKGQNDFYVGYPFVIGRLPGELFNVRAPLVLIPVTMERNPSEIKIKMDDSRDIIYNNTLILAYYSFNNIKKPLPSDVVENTSSDGFIERVIDYYKGMGLEIANTYAEHSKFKEYTEESFPKYKCGELFLDDAIVLGKYPSYSNSIHKDFEKIIEKNEANEILNGLLKSYNVEEDSTDDSYFGDIEETDFDKKLQISEKDMTYITDLNYSQEKVLSLIKSMDEIVVEGPPGTGKSQTIVSLMSDFVCNNKTVLMVSEKKTALDVVYSRLGNLSKYALIIDDASDKTPFYRQLSNIFNTTDNEKSIEELDTISIDIDNKVKRLETIATSLYSPDNFGIEPYKMYQIECEENLNNKVTYDTEKIVRNNYDLFSLKYNDLCKSHSQFKNNDLSNNVDRCRQYLLECPYLSAYPEYLDSYGMKTLEMNFEKIGDEVNIWRSKGTLSRIFGKGSVRKNVQEFVKSNFPSADLSEMTNVILDGKINCISSGLNQYNDYLILKPTYVGLFPNERMYFEAMVTIKHLCGNSLSKANDNLFGNVILWHIRDFEKNNNSILSDVYCFKSIIDEIEKEIEEKKRISALRMESILNQDISNVKYSKRYGKICQELEKKRKISVSRFASAYRSELFRGVKIWLLTPEVVSEIIPLKSGLFDLVVFDEASQMYVEKGIPSIVRAKKVVIAGDHKQLRPSSLGVGRYSTDEEDDEQYEYDSNKPIALDDSESFLDVARFTYVKNVVMLNYHYRSKYEELIAFSNYAFYGGKLYVSPNVSTPSEPPIVVHKIEDARWIDRKNEKEARKVVELLREFFERRTENETIGIITFNSSQRDLIDDIIDEECHKDPNFNILINKEIDRRANGEDIGLFVKNIENVQGDERDEIIFSITYAKGTDGRIHRNFGWLNNKGGENRLNVAISRAKKKVQIVTSFDPSELQTDDLQNDGPRLLKKYLQYSLAISEGNKELAKSILNSFSDDPNPGKDVRFDSDFENQVYNALINRGFDVDTQIGIGGYSIDLAIKKNGNYILGIECDGKLYHSSKSARERDYHRQKYLESRGWRIYRIWSPKWWKDPALEIKKIEEMIKSFSSDFNSKKTKYTNKYENKTSISKVKESPQYDKEIQIQSNSSKDNIVNTPTSSYSNISRLKGLANDGDIKAMFQLGLIYEKGHGVHIDNLTAAIFYRDAAENGHKQAQYNLAQMYLEGRGVGKDHEEAISLLKKSSKKGYKEATEQLKELEK